MSCFLEFSHLKPNETVKSSTVTLYMTFERILKDLNVSCVAKTQVCRIAFAQAPGISQLYASIMIFDISHGLGDGKIGTYCSLHLLSISLSSEYLAILFSSREDNS